MMEVNPGRTLMYGDCHSFDGMLWRVCKMKNVRYLKIFQPCTASCLFSVLRSSCLVANHLEYASLTFTKLVLYSRVVVTP